MYGPVQVNAVADILRSSPQKYPKSGTFDSRSMTGCEVAGNSGCQIVKMIQYVTYDKDNDYVLQHTRKLPQRTERTM
jgi:hypothetical protein